MVLCGTHSGSDAIERCKELDGAKKEKSHVVAALLTQIDPFFQGVEPANVVIEFICFKFT